MNGRILIVDDEEIVIRSCLRILAADNYEVDTSQMMAWTPWEKFMRKTTMC